MSRNLLTLFLAGSIMLAGGSTAALATTSDPAGDFLPTYVGPMNGDLDVLSVDVRRSSTSFILTSTQAAAIGTTPGVSYVWGINRGQGTARFGALASGVLFDSVLLLRPNGTGNFNDLLNSGNSFALPAGAITISGATISGVVSIASIPSTGFAAADYTFNLWPRAPGAGNGFIADFAPNNSNISSVVPEPSSWAMLIAGLGLTGAALRRRRVAFA